MPVFDWTGRRTAWAVGLLLTLLCLVLPTRNSTVDAWAYAAQVRYGHDLLLPHHLWHSCAGWLWLRLLHALGRWPDALAALKALNALAYGAVLAVLGCLLRRLGGPLASVAAWLLAVGSCWGLLRYATENETYVLPLLAAVLASAAWVRATAKQAANSSTDNAGHQKSSIKPLGCWVLAGAAAALAGLLHQVMIWWWLGLLLGTLWGPKIGPRRTWRPAAAAWYALPGLVAWPLAYAGALPTWGLPLRPTALLHFVLHDYYTGAAGEHHVTHGFLLTTINIFRTLGQLHGYLLPLLRRWPALLLVPLAAVSLAAYAGWLALRQQRQPVATRAVAPALNTALPYSEFGLSSSMPGAMRHAAATHGLIFGLQLVFAALSDGNAEFMVMLPVLGAIAVLNSCRVRQLPGAAVAAGGAALLAWNVAFGLLPLHFLTLQDTAPLHRLLATQPQARLLLTDGNLLLNQHFYRTGQAAPPPQVLPGPARLLRHGPAAARAALDSVRRAGHPIYTDLTANSHPLDRAQIAYSTENESLILGLPVHPTDSTRTFYGWYRVFLIR